MDVRELETLVAVAEELHFGRAAKRLGVTQPSVSQHLRRLEDEVGCTLVARTSRAISLTEAGELLLPVARRALAEVDRATAVIADFKRGMTGRLVIGSLGAGLNGPLPELLIKLRPLAPETTIELHHFPDSATQERALLAGTLDIGVVRQVSADRALTSYKLFDEAFVVYVPEDHPLAGATELGIRDLADADFVSWPRRLGPTFYDLIVEGLHRQGVTPRIVGVGDSLEAQLSLVAAGYGVSLQAASNASITRAGVRTVPLRAADLSAPLWLACRTWNRSVAVSQLVDQLPRR